MRIGIVVDSACDLPQDFIERHAIRILPITIHLPGGDLVDVRDPAVTMEFYAGKSGGAADAGSSPQTVEQLKELFLSRLVLDFDFVFCLTIASSRSPIFENATKASLAILSDYKAIRAKAGVAGPFALRVIDSQTLFAGQAVIAAEVVRELQSGQTNPNRIRERLDFLVQNTYGYMLPRDLFYLRTRAQKKGDRSVGLVSAFLGSALDIKPLLRGFRNETGPVAKLRHFDDGARRLFEFTGTRVKAGLLTPILCLSYGGDLAELRALPGYGDLIGTCRAHQVEVLESVMSVTGGVNVGAGAVAVGFAAEPHEVTV